MTDRDPQTLAECEAAIIGVSLEFQSAPSRSRRAKAWRRLQELNGIKRAMTRAEQQALAAEQAAG